MFAKLERAGCSRVHRTLMTPGLELSFLIESKALSSTKTLRVYAVGKAIPARSDQSHGLQHNPPVLPDLNEKTSIMMHFTRKTPWHRLCAMLIYTDVQLIFSPLRV